MATNADFDALIGRITTATNTLEVDVAAINNGSSSITASVQAAQTAASESQASATQAASSSTNASQKAVEADASAQAAAQTKVETQAIADNLKATAPFQEAPEDGKTYGRNNKAWVEVVAGGGGAGTVTSVNSIAPDVNGNVTLTSTDVGAKPNSYVPTYSEITGKPTTFPPTIGTTADTALAGNTVIPTNTNQLTNGSGFITSAQVPVQSVAGKTGAVTLAAGDITSGTFAVERLGSGTPTGDMVLYGDGTWDFVQPPQIGHNVAAFRWKGSVVTNWPYTNPNSALWIGDCANSTGTVSGAALFSSVSNLNNIPAGRYVFRGTDFSSGPLSGGIGFITVDRGELSAGNFGNRATAYLQGLTGDSVGKMFVLRTSDGTWLPV